MADDEQHLVAAVARGDRQHAHVSDALDDLVINRARELLTAYDPIGAWALLQRELHEQLGDTPAHVRFMAELLAAAALREATRGHG
jgi:hypothetical protein